MKRLLFIALASIILLITGCQQEDTTQQEGSTDTNDDTKYEDYVYTKYDLDVKDKVKLGEEDAENTFVLAFDYSCPWCHKWMMEVLPEIEKSYIDNGQANYVGQPLVMLDQTSLQLSHVDYFIEKNKPEKLYDFQLKMANEAGTETFGTEEHILSTLSDYGINSSLEELEKNNPDPISITRNYTKNFGVEFVPTLYINGIKVYNAFSLEEIEKIITGEIKENDVIKVPVSEE